MKKYTIEGKHFSVCFDVWENKAMISGGCFGKINVVQSPVFRAVIKNLNTATSEEITSLSDFEFVDVRDNSKYIEFYFANPKGVDGLVFVVCGKKLQDAIEWSVDIMNDNCIWSVMRVEYPTPVVSSEMFDLFIPVSSGRVIKDAGNKGYYKNTDGDFVFFMNYFAAYDKMGGVYVGIEDPKASIKRYEVEAKDKKAIMRVEFFGINGGEPANSFTVSGTSKWQYFEGDWYDATQIYADFVYSKAEWLPQIDENGRPDTPERFKNLPFWIYEHMPNSEYQRDNRPRSLMIQPIKRTKDYWYKAAIELQEELGVPVGYHVYNWHHIPFNIEYPHFMPAKPEFNEGARELRKHNIYVLPYINALSWEARDFEAGHEVNFENTGKHGAVMDDKGNHRIVQYPQTTISGQPSYLAAICPTSPMWHTMIENTVRQMEEELEIDGIYFDQVSATIGRPCYNKEHNHTMGGGSYWVDSYNLMMKKINAKKPKDSFYFSECNIEGYMKNFDGYLTWMWACGDEVPAFPCVYAGYIQMLGRMTEGAKKEDVNFFKFQTAKSLLYGQQIGWCNVDVISNAERMEFLKKIVSLRYRYTKLFNAGKLLRPPVVETNLEPIYTTPALRYKREVEMPQVLSGAWQFKDGSKTVIFLINTANTSADYKLSFNFREYGIKEDLSGKGFVYSQDECIIKGTLQPMECISWEID